MNWLRYWATWMVDVQPYTITNLAADYRVSDYKGHQVTLFCRVQLVCARRVKSVD